ncbi:MAG: transcriptional repressor LexA [Tissierellia bacterium]|nr:transcriptional repressor LexA [Tissierellia bacterium]
MYDDLTDKQVEILLYIKRNIQSVGYPPTVREICKAVGIKSTSSVHSALEKLERLEYIRRDASKTRAIEVIEKNKEFNQISKKTIDVPLIGQVSAGTPILAVENITDTFPLSVDVVKNRELFLLKVNGESMIEVGIHNGDYALINKQNTAENGEIVLALIDEEFSTIKTYYKESDHYRLQPENQSMNPIISRNVQILGKLIGIFRYL